MTRSTLIRRSLAAAAGAAVVSAIAVGTAFADDGRGPGMMRGGRGGRHPIFALVCMVAIAGAAILATWLILRRRPQSVAFTPVASVAATAPSPTAGAEAILAERLARSEISPDDYRSMLAALRETTVAAATAATPSAPVTPEDAS